MRLNASIIKSSFEEIKPIALEAASYFYETLFSNYPESKAIFMQPDMERQKKSLVDSLIKIINGFDDQATLATYLQTLGGKHQVIGVKEEHYAMMGRSLITTLRHFFKNSWTSELEDQWIGAIGFIADNMLQGAKQKPTPVAATPSQPTSHFGPQIYKSEPHDLAQVVRQIARSILFKALDDEMDGDFMKSARKKAANILTQAIRDEADQLQNSLNNTKKKTA